MSDIRAEYLGRIMRHLLPVPDFELSASSFYVNFLIGITKSLTHYQPTSVQFNTTGEYFIAEANGHHLAFTERTIDLFPEILDIENFKTMRHPEGTWDIFPGFSFLSTIVRASEYCLVDISTEIGLYRQAFFQGSPLGTARLMNRSTSNEGVLRFFFTIPTDTDAFANTYLDVQILKRGISYWRKVLLRKTLPEDVKVPRLRMKWRVQSAYNHSLRIDFQYPPTT